MVVLRNCIIAMILLTTLGGTSALQAEWPEDGVSICNQGGSLNDPRIISDGAGGCIAVWEDRRIQAEIYAQRLDSYGKALWAANGVAVCSATGYQRYPRIIPDGEGGAFITWDDDRGADIDIYAQRIDENGNALWTPNGVVVCNATGIQMTPHIAAAAEGGCLIAWRDARSGNEDIYIQKLDENGDTLWTANGVALCTEANNQYVPQVIGICYSGAIVAWHDRRGGGGGVDDIYAQRVNASGAVQWTPDGVAICTATGNQHSPRIVSDCACGAIIVWKDFRTGQADVYAQRVNINGSIYWAADGIAICSASIYQEQVEIISDGNFGAIVTWTDSRNPASNYDIYAQRVDGGGNMQWTADGIAICAAGQNQIYPDIVSDGLDGAIIVWEDRRHYIQDIFAQRVDGDGNVQWTADGVALCKAHSGQYEPFAATDGAGGAFAVWNDVRYSTNQLFVQRIERNGYWGYPSPYISATRDVPGDQGGYINLAFDGSRLDLWPDELIAEYTVWRAISSTEAALLVSAGKYILTGALGDPPDISKDVIRIEQLGSSTYYWKQVSTLDAHHLESYSEVVPTLFDSTAASTEYHYFQAIAHANDPAHYWISSPDSSYSVDNLAPAAPLGLAGEQSYTPEGLTLFWDPNTEADLGYYAIYRGTSEDFVPAPGNLIASPPDTFHFDGDWRWDDGYYYKVSAVDIHGNESPYALFASDNVSGGETPGTPHAYFLKQNFPNPFNPATRITFALKEPAHVALRIYDVSGRLVRVLVDEMREARVYDEVWDGTDGSGRAAASGIYFYRIEAGAFHDTKKMVLLR